MTRYTQMYCQHSRKDFSGVLMLIVGAILFAWLCLAGEMVLDIMDYYK